MVALDAIGVSVVNADERSVLALCNACERYGMRVSPSGFPVRISLQTSNGGRPLLASDESYRLSIGAGGIEVDAPELWGALHGLATLAQLASAGDVPCGVIEDRPGLAWRGVMLDPARHFLPLSLLEQTIDMMAFFKLNVLHLHLSDDQGCRFRSERYPAIASKDGSYDPAELTALVEFAAERGVRVVAELDVPGHVSALVAGYPQWGMTPTDEPGQPSNRFGVHRECLNVARPQVRCVIKELFEELVQIFGDECLHIGGDEVSTKAWADDAVVADYLASEGLAGVAELQPHFNRDLIEYLHSLGRRGVVWDEALHESLPADTIVQAWRGVTALERALHAGHDTVLSAPYYLDLFFPLDAHTRFRPDAPLSELLLAEDALRRDSRLAHISEGMAWTDHWRSLPDAEPTRERGRLLGAEACLWGELVDAEVLPVRLWSRMVGLADLFWRPREEHANAWRERQSVGTDRLQRCLGIDTNPDFDAVRAPSEFLTQPGGLEFVSWLEPVKWYARLLGEDALNARLMGTEMPQARPYKADTPLDSLADVLPPESFASWRLDEIVGEFLAGSAGAREQLTALVGRWTELAVDCDLPEHLWPLSALLGDAGTAVLQRLQGGKADLSGFARAAERPVGEYVLSIAPALHRLANEWPP